MNWKPKLAALASLVTLCVALAACNSDKGTGPKDTNPIDTTGTDTTGTDTTGTDATELNVTWYSTATQYRDSGNHGLRVAYACPDSGSAGIIWGSDVYTDDSSVCTAAVHAGKITLAMGGRVVIEIRPGRASYDSLTRNGVTSYTYGAWGGSYVFAP